jgi:hypothetical protein
MMSMILVPEQATSQDERPLGTLDDVRGFLIPVPEQANISNENILKQVNENRRIIVIEFRNNQDSSDTF